MPDCPPTAPPIVPPTAAPPAVPSTAPPIAPPTTVPSTSLAPAPSSQNPVWFHEDAISPLAVREYDDAIPPLTIREDDSDDESSVDSYFLDSAPPHNSFDDESETGSVFSRVSGFDNESDGDSLMPRRRGKHKWDEGSTATMSLLSLCSGSTGSLYSADDNSTDSEGAWNFVDVGPDDASTVSYSSSASSGSGLDSLGSCDSVASMPTVIHGQPTITTPSPETLEAVREATIGKKAVRADDAAVPVTLWDMRISGDRPVENRTKAFTGFRAFGRRMFLRAIYSDCIDELEKEFGAAWPHMARTVDGRMTKLAWRLQGIRNLLWYVDNTNFFEYKAGSKTYYFRFPMHYRKMVRDGCPIFFESPGPELSHAELKRIQPQFRDPAVKAEMYKKVMKVKKRRYLLGTTLENLKSIIKYFAVPKGDSDVRIVYDATASGLNERVWSPSFWLPTIDSLIRALDVDSWMADRDIGDMFLNFELHHSAWPFCGVDLAPVLDPVEAAGVQCWYHWVRNLMGFKPSPWSSIRTALVSEEVIKGDRHDDRNPFQWEKVVLNPPGPGYVPTKAWVYKVRKDSSVACDMFTFVDDERVTGPTEESTWQAGHTTGAKQAYLGIQDAARKVGPCSQTPRAWAGAVVHVVSDLGVCVLTSEEKWLKLQKIIGKYLELLLSGEEELDHKELLSDRGFLVYVTRAYPGMVPYLKGFHLTIEMWRGNRDSEGWKLHAKAMEGSALPNSALGSSDDDTAELAYLMRKKNVMTARAPESGKTRVAPRLLSDLKALKALSSAPLPPLRVVRPTQVVQVLYGFADASGKGLGSTVQSHPSRTLTVSPTNPRFRVGVWGTDDEAESSNFRELANLVLTVEEEAAAGHLTRAEFYLFTDNSTAESAFYKGSSTSPKLHALILRLRKLELLYGLILHIIHVSGKRMIAQGTDGCSRGVLLEGVMAGEDMLSFVELGKSAIERSPALLPWIQSWCLDSSIQPLTPEEWYERGHGIVGGTRDKRNVWIPDHEPSGQTHLWAPSPSAADAALEELLKARHKRTDTYHIVVVPRLLTPRWRRLFHKAADCCFTVAPGSSFWTSDMYEPLWVAVVLPYYRHSPWQLGRSPLMVDMGRKLHRLCSDSEAHAGHLLCKLCKLPRRLATVSPGVARAVLRMPRPGLLPSGSSA